jgi:hypothetical protein
MISCSTTRTSKCRRALLATNWRIAQLLFSSMMATGSKSPWRRRSPSHIFLEIAKPKWEFPRLCREGSKILTYPG